MNKPTWIQTIARLFPPKSEYGSRAVWIPTLKRYIHFCLRCGEYITQDTGCSNPFCPNKIDEYDSGLDNRT